LPIAASVYGQFRQNGKIDMKSSERYPATPATRALAKAGIAFTTYIYDYDYDYDGADGRLGMHAAAAIGLPADRVFKTLLAEVDGTGMCAIVPVDRVLSMKRLAAAVGGKSAIMMQPDKAEKMTGYHVGGISPFGHRRPVRAALDESALEQPLIVVNGGKRGFLIGLSPQDALEVLDAVVAPLCAET